MASILDAYAYSGTAPETHLDFTNLHLYGRESQLNTLCEAYKRSSSSSSSSSNTTNKSCQVVWLRGYAGVGKSTLVEHSFQNRDAFCSGKFDRSRTAQPFAALVNLLSRLCCVLEVDYPPIQLSPDDASILSRLLPDVYQVLDCGGSSSTSSQSSDVVVVYKAEWSFEKLKNALRSFVEGVCDALPSPASLIMFLDDLQWADTDSLQLIKALLVTPDRHGKNGGVKGLMFIGAYRDNEVDPGSPLADFMQEITDRTTDDKAITQIHLKDLEKPCIDRLVEDVTQMSPLLAQPLSDLVYAKTAGNCFFTLHMLRHIFAKEFLEFSKQTSRWEWNIEKIRVEVDVSVNVVDFMTQKLRGLPQESADILQIAACLGSRNDIQLLEALLPIFHDSANLPPLVEILRYASEEHLIELNSDQTRFKFSHDRIQTAAYDLIPAGAQRQNRHLQIGRHLQKVTAADIATDEEEEEGEENHDSTAKRWQFLLAVDQLNRAEELIADDAEKVEMARLNLQAAEQVVKQSAFKMAAQFLETGIEFLGLHRWDKHYELTLDLNNALVSVLFSNGLMMDTLDLIQYMYGRARCDEDLRKVQMVHVEVLACLNRLPECLELGFRTLKDLGHPKIPRKPGLMNIIPAMIGVKRALQGRNDEQLLDLPTCEDPKVLSIMRYLGVLVPVSFFAGEENLIPVLTCRMMQLSLRHGVSESSSYAFASYGFALTVTGDFDGAFRFAMLALKLMERFYEDARTLVMVYGLIYHLKRPAIDSNAHTLRAYHVSFAQGDLHFTGQAIAMHAVSRLVAGMKLENLVKDIFSFCDQLQAYDQLLMWDNLICLQRGLLELVGRPNAISQLTFGVVLDNDAFEAYLQKSNSGMISFFFWMYTSWARFYLGDLKSALIFAEKCWKSKGLQGAFVYSVPYFLFSALIALDSWKTSRKSRHWRIFRKFHRELNKWVQRGNPNTYHIVKMLDAELLIVHRNSKLDAVRNAYDKSIALACRGGFRHDAALANERVGRYFLKERGDSYWGNHYLTRAKDLYNDWGCTAKVEDLALRYGASVNDESMAFGSAGQRISIKGRSQILKIALVEKSLNRPLLSMDPQQPSVSSLLPGGYG